MGNALAPRGIGGVNGGGWGAEADCASLFRPTVVCSNIVTNLCGR